MTKLSENISACWNSRFQHSGLSARLLAETIKSTGMLGYFAHICLQIFTFFSQIFDVPRTYVSSKATVEAVCFVKFLPFALLNL